MGNAGGRRKGGKGGDGGGDGGGGGPGGTLWTLASHTACADGAGLVGGVNTWLQRALGSAKFKRRAAPAVVAAAQQGRHSTRKATLLRCAAPCVPCIETPHSVCTPDTPAIQGRKPSAAPRPRSWAAACPRRLPPRGSTAPVRSCTQSCCGRPRRSRPWPACRSPAGCRRTWARSRCRRRSRSPPAERHTAHGRTAGVRCIQGRGAHAALPLPQQEPSCGEERVQARGRGREGRWARR